MATKYIPSESGWSSTIQGWGTPLHLRIKCVSTYDAATNKSTVNFTLQGKVDNTAFGSNMYGFEFTDLYNQGGIWIGNTTYRLASTTTGKYLVTASTAAPNNWYDLVPKNFSIADVVLQHNSSGVATLSLGAYLNQGLYDGATFRYGINGSTTKSTLTLTESKPFTITYNANGGSGAPAAQSVYGGTNTLSSTKPTRTGYSFLGWATSSSATTASYAAGGSINVTANVTLYAVWKLLTYNLSISQGTGTTVTVKRGTTTLSNGASINYGETLSIAISAQTGYSISSRSHSDGSVTVTGNLSVSATASVLSYKLTISAGANSSITVSRTSSPKAGAATGALSNNATIYYSDVLKISFAASSGYAVNTHTVNGSTFTSGNNHTVTGNVSVVSSATGLGSTISSMSSAVTTGNAFSLAVTRYNTAYYEKAVFTVGATVLYTSSVFTDNLSFTVPHSWFDAYGTSSSLTVRCTITTYTNSSATTQIGSTDYRDFTVNLNASQKPTLASGCATLTAYNTGTSASVLTGSPFVQGYSKVHAVVNTSKITHANGASAQKYSISFANVLTESTATTFNSSNTTTTSGTIAVIFRVTDTRDRYAETTINISVNAYAKPKPINVSAFRCVSDGTESEDGTYFYAQAQSSFSAITSNACTLNVRHYVTSWTDDGTLTSGVARVIGGTIDPDVALIVRITATDSLGNSSYVEVSIPARVYIIRSNPSGTAVGIGMKPTGDKILQIPQDWKIDYSVRKAIDIPSGTDLDSLTQYGKYKCSSSATAASLVNCPTTYSFSLWFFCTDDDSTSSTWNSQIIRDNQGDMYHRVKRGSTTWNDWVQIPQIDADRGVFTTFADNNGAAYSPDKYIDYDTCLIRGRFTGLGDLGNNYLNLLQIKMLSTWKVQVVFSNNRNDSKSAIAIRVKHDDTIEAWRYVNYADHTYAVNAGGAYNCDVQYDAGLYEIQGGSNTPTGTYYGTLLVNAYRKPYGNTKPDYASQIYFPTGDTAVANADGMWYRNSLADSWRSWQRVATDKTAPTVEDFTISAGSSKSFLMEQKSAVMVVGAVSSRRVCYIFINGNSNQALSVIPLLEHADITYTYTTESSAASTRQVTFSNSYTYAFSVRVTKLL